MEAITIKIRRKGIVLLIMILLCIPALCSLTPSAHATDGIGDISEFDEYTEGDGQYLNSQYRDNMSLDIEETSFWESGDAILNSVANILFNFVRNVGYATVALYHFVQQFQLADFLSGAIDKIMLSLKTGIFDELWTLGMIAVIIGMAIKLWHQNLRGMMTDFLKVIAIFVIASVVTTNASSAIIFTVSLTKQISDQTTADIASAQDDEDAAAQTGSTTEIEIWKNLVVNPWKTLEFGKTDAQDDEVFGILSCSYGSDERKDAVASYIDGKSDQDPDVMSKSLGGSRIASIFFYLIPFMFKCVIYLLMSILQLCYQGLAILYVLLAPVIMFLALFPSTGGFGLIGAWLRKIFETQVVMLILAIFTGFILQLDNTLYNAAGETWGWLGVSLVEMILFIFLFFNRNKLLHVLGRLDFAVQHPKTIQNMLNRRGNMPQRLGEAAEDAVRATGSVAYAAMQAGNRLYAQRPRYSPVTRDSDLAWSPLEVSGAPAMQDTPGATATPERPTYADTVITPKPPQQAYLPQETEDQYVITKDAADAADAMFNRTKTPDDTEPTEPPPTQQPPTHTPDGNAPDDPSSYAAACQNAANGRYAAGRPRLSNANPEEPNDSFGRHAAKEADDENTPAPIGDTGSVPRLHADRPRLADQQTDNAVENNTQPSKNADAPDTSAEHLPAKQPELTLADETEAVTPPLIDEQRMPQQIPERPKIAEQSSTEPSPEYKTQEPGHPVDEREVPPTPEAAELPNKPQRTTTTTTRPKNTGPEIQEPPATGNDADLEPAAELDQMRTARRQERHTNSPMPAAQDDTTK